MLTPTGLWIHIPRVSTDWLQSGAILKFTHDVADRLAEEFSGEPLAELRTWLSIAEQPEAMVVAVYDTAAIQRRLPPRQGPDDKVGDIAAKAIGGIWAQEVSHTRLIESLRRVGEEQATRAQQLQGSIEGRMTDLASGQGMSGAVARWLIGLARVTGQAPEFTAGITAMRFDQFCRFTHELEETTSDGYRRIVELMKQIQRPAGNLDVEVLYGIDPDYDIKKTLAEERFHTVTLNAIAAWVNADGVSFDPERTAREGFAELRVLAEETCACPAFRSSRRSL